MKHLNRPRHTDIYLYQSLVRSTLTSDCKMRDYFVHESIQQVWLIYISKSTPMLPTWTFSVLNNYRSFLVVSMPQGSLVRLVWPALFSQVWRPLRGPGAGTLALEPGVALSLSAARSCLVVSGVRSS